MNYSLRLLIIVSLFLSPLGVGVALCQEGSKPGVAPLSLEGYLDEELPEASPQNKNRFAGNDPCFVCHRNYDGESLVQTHSAGQIGCIECHGQSDAHRNDEDNITPPDKMYGLSKVDGFCQSCHQTHDATARKVIARWQEKASTKNKTADIVCTDCHFEHRLARRIVRWEK